MAKSEERKSPIIEELLGGDGEIGNIQSADIPTVTTGLEAPAIYADVIRGVNIFGETSKINLLEHRTDALDDKLKAIHVATIIVPTSQLRGWANLFTKLADVVDAVKSGAAEE